MATGVYLLDERTPHLTSSLYIVSVLSVIPLQIKIMHPDRFFIILRLIALDWKIRAKAVGYGLSPLLRVLVLLPVGESSEARLERNRSVFDFPRPCWPHSFWVGVATLKIGLELSGFAVCPVSDSKP